MISSLPAPSFPVGTFSVRVDTGPGPRQPAVHKPDTTVVVYSHGDSARVTANRGGELLLDTNVQLDRVGSSLLGSAVGHFLEDAAAVVDAGSTRSTGYGMGPYSVLAGPGLLDTAEGERALEDTVVDHDSAAREISIVVDGAGAEGIIRSTLAGGARAPLAIGHAVQSALALAVVAR